MAVKDKNILIAITASIAAYKINELIRLLRKDNAHVRVMISQHAMELTSTKTLEALSANKVISGYDDTLNIELASMAHIDLARWADCMIIAPASANSIAKAALGIPDNLIITTLLACNGLPILLAPAMNTQMWEHPHTQNHVCRLKELGYTLVGPIHGEQACGDVGLGNLAPPEQLFAAITEACNGDNNHCFDHIMITSGPTQEPIDAARYISNYSSGKMGFALAQAAMNIAKKVTLISGPTQLTCSNRINRIDVTTCEQMYQQVHHLIDGVDCFIGAAAVADFKVAQPSKNKLKKQALTQLKLIANPDIVASVAQRDNKPYTVAFAAQTESLESHAKQKLKNKKVDLLFANYVNPGDSIGFQSDNNQGVAFWHNESQTFPLQSKQILATELMKLISRNYHQQKQLA
jgi:phosphopantothenoylcysteine decarboxylase / phosphopantothenate---cysteine ligase